jgi:hypothetical protein
VRLLDDRESSDAPPINLFYRPSVRRIARVRAFLEFVIELFEDLERRSGRRVAAATEPAWLRRRYPRAFDARAGRH